MFKRILVPLDGSVFSTRSIFYATSIASSFDAEIILLRAMMLTPLITPTGMEGLPEVASPWKISVTEKEILRRDRKTMNYMRQYLRKKLQPILRKDINASYMVKIGAANEVIKSVVRKEKIDLVVMTTRGAGGLKRAVMGSVADDVIRHTQVPVLAINK